MISINTINKLKRELFNMRRKKVYDVYRMRLLESSISELEKAKRNSDKIKA